MFPDPGIDPEHAKNHPAKILVAEDMAMNRELIVGLLHAMGYMPDTVQNGLQAVKAAERQQYDLILLDIHMPVMDGLEAAAALRGQGYIVAASIDHDPFTRQQAREAGCQDFLAKPVRSAELAFVIRQSISADPQPLPEADQQRTGSPLDELEVGLNQQEINDLRRAFKHDLAAASEYLHPDAKKSDMRLALHSLRALAGYAGHAHHESIFARAYEQVEKGEPLTWPPIQAALEDLETIFMLRLP